MSKRSTHEVFERHLELRKQGKLEEDIRQNYAGDCVLLTSYGVFHGHDGVRESAEILNRHVPEGNYHNNTKHVHEDTAFLVWSAQTESVSIQNGADSFVIRDGLIRVQTIYYTLIVTPQP